MIRPREPLPVPGEPAPPGDSAPDTSLWFTCIDCGERTRRAYARGRPPLRCPPCRQAYRVADRQQIKPVRRCPTCRGPVQRGSHMTYCSADCRTAAAEARAASAGG